jgi:putative nucleotidyltransferase with HDIG domain
MIARWLLGLRLRPLADLSHPALKELVVHAPGTYHHSILMGAMADAAARAVGADPLLARVGAYYHDIGKGRNAAWFGENDGGDGRHDALAPSTSALVIKRHVADGVELARGWNLPTRVVDVIAEHHGTRPVGYFWAKAQREQEEGRASPEARDLDESTFRYPGPRPRTREAALVMIADACEASARANGFPDGEALRALVARRTQEIVDEGQLALVGFGAGELEAITAAMARALEAAGRTDAAAAPRPAPPLPGAVPPARAAAEEAR